LFAAANCNDLASNGDGQAASLAAWLLPIVKTLGAELAFDNASGAIQVLGGAGYTREWPAEQSLRDARVLAVFEGTTGMQGQDLALRRVLADRTSFDAFLSAAKQLEESRLVACLTALEEGAALIHTDPDNADAAATSFLRLSMNAALAWIGAGYLQEEDPVLSTAANHWLDGAQARNDFHLAQMRNHAACKGQYDAVRKTLG
jgi:hypothetical protein